MVRMILYNKSFRISYLKEYKREIRIGRLMSFICLNKSEASYPHLILIIVDKNITFIGSLPLTNGI
jgi:hypothetical protein